MDGYEDGYDDDSDGDSVGSADGDFDGNRVSAGEGAVGDRVGVSVGGLSQVVSPDASQLHPEMRLQLYS